MSWKNSGITQSGFNAVFQEFGVSAVEADPLGFWKCGYQPVYGESIVIRGKTLPELAKNTIKIIVENSHYSTLNKLS